MKTAKVILLAVVGLLLLADISWRIWIWHSEAPFRAQFKFEYFYTNGVASFGIEDARTSKPLLINWDFGDGEKLGEVSYYFQGTNLLDIYLKTNQLPRYRFIFHGPEKSEIWWLDRRGVGSFTERIFYDTNSDLSKHEVWYNESWQTVDRRNEKNGIVINGQWNQLAFDTNGNWTINTNR
jgi:hypothetical protein